MTDSWLDKIKEFFGFAVRALGPGTLIGAAVGGGISALAGGWGWGLAGLLVLPLGAIAGGLVGDFANRDGPVFGGSIQRQQAEDGHIAGLYLHQNSDVREQLLSGEAARRGLYRTAREHYERFGRAEGRQWPSRENLLQFGGSPNQPCDIAHIPASMTGNVTLSPDAFLMSVLERNHGIVFAERTHGNSAIPNFLASHVPALRGAGVMDVFVEAGAAQQVHIDNYYRTRDESHLRQLSMTYRFQTSADFFELIKACEAAGIRVHCIDNTSIPPQTLRAYRFPQEFIRENGQEAHDAGMQHFYYMRDMVNQEWVDCVQRNARGRWVLLGGAHHTLNYAGMQDIDEMLAAQRNENVVQVMLESTNPRATQATISRPWAGVEYPHAGYTDIPEFHISVPGVHTEAVEAARRVIGQGNLSPAQSIALEGKCHDIVDGGQRLRAHLIHHFRIVTTLYSEDVTRQDFLHRLMQDHNPVYYQSQSGNFAEAAAGYRRLIQTIDAQFPNEHDRPDAITHFRRCAQRLQSQCEEMQRCLVTPRLLGATALPAIEAAIAPLPANPLPIVALDEHYNEAVHQAGRLLNQQQVTTSASTHPDASRNTLPIMASTTPQEKDRQEIGRYV